MFQEFELLVISTDTESHDRRAPSSDMCWGKHSLKKQYTFTNAFLFFLPVNKLLDYLCFFQPHW